MGTSNQWGLGGSCQLQTCRRVLSPHHRTWPTSLLHIVFGACGGPGFGKLELPLTTNPVTAYFPLFFSSLHSCISWSYQVLNQPISQRTFIFPSPLSLLPLFQIYRSPFLHPSPCPTEFPCLNLENAFIMLKCEEKTVPEWLGWPFFRKDDT